MIVRVPVRATKADLLRVCAENPAWSVELESDGTLRMSPPAGGGSSYRNLKIGALLERWGEEHGYAAFDSSAGFEFEDGVIVSPDAALIRRDRFAALTDEQVEGFLPLVPDIAVELVSRSDRPTELREKLLDLRRRGAEFVVLVDPYRATIWTDGTAPSDFPDLTGVLSLPRRTS